MDSVLSSSQEMPSFVLRQRNVHLMEIVLTKTNVATAHVVPFAKHQLSQVLVMMMMMMMIIIIYIFFIIIIIMMMMMIATYLTFFLNLYIFGPF
jgi:hypothetical protein